MRTPRRLPSILLAVLALTSLTGQAEEAPPVNEAIIETAPEADPSPPAPPKEPGEEATPVAEEPSAEAPANPDPVAGTQAEPQAEPAPLDLQDCEQRISQGSVPEAMQALSDISMRRLHEARPILLRAFERPELAVRLAGVNAYANMGMVYPEERLSVEAIASDASVPPDKRAFAAQVLARMGDRRSLPLLIKLLEHPEPNVVTSVAKALVAMTGSDFGTRVEAWRDWREATAAAEDARLEGIVARLESRDRPKMLAAMDELMVWQEVRYETHDILFSYMDDKDPEIAKRAEYVLRVTGCPEPPRMDDLRRRIQPGSGAPAKPAVSATVRAITALVAVALVIISGLVFWKWGRPWLAKRYSIEHATEVFKRRLYTATGSFRRKK